MEDRVESRRTRHLRLRHAAVCGALGALVLGSGSVASAGERGSQSGVSWRVAAAGKVVTCFGSEPTIVGADPSRPIVGTSGPDVILAVGSNGQVDGMGGDDLICGRVALDVMAGGQGNDRIKGEFDGFARDLQGGDQLFGGAGDDVLLGGEGSDTLYGEDGNDRLNGQHNDSLAEPNNGRPHSGDRLYPGPGDDVVRGGYDDVTAGDHARWTIDVMHFDGATAGVTVENGVATGPGLGRDVVLGSVEGYIGTPYDDDLTLSTSIAVAIAMEGDDVLRGAPGGRNELDGRQGDDTLVGDSGPDELQGGSGQDRVVGLGGDDYLSAGSWDSTAVVPSLAGGGGDDRLRVSALPEGGVVDGGTGDDRLYFGDAGVQSMALDVPGEHWTVNGSQTSLRRLERYDISDMTGTLSFTGGAGPDVLTLGCHYAVAGWCTDRVRARGGAGADRLSVTSHLSGEDNLIVGGAGHDRVSLLIPWDSDDYGPLLRVDLATKEMRMDGSPLGRLDAEIVTARANEVSLLGTDGADRLFGGGTAIDVRGREGDDVLSLRYTAPDWTPESIGDKVARGGPVTTSCGAAGSGTPCSADRGATGRTASLLVIPAVPRSRPAASDSRDRVASAAAMSGSEGWNRGAAAGP